MSNRLFQAGGAAVGGVATVLVAEKAGLSPMWAGVATSGAALAGAALIKNPTAKDAFYAAGLGATGVAAVQVFAGWWAKRKIAEEQQKRQQDDHAKDSKDSKTRKASGDAPYVTRQELDDALAHAADRSVEQQKQQTCDLLTALREEIKRVVVDMKPANDGTVAKPLPVAFRVAPLRSAVGEDDYMRNAYGDEPRDAYVEDDYMRNAYGDERDAAVYDERDAAVYEERGAAGDERDAAVYDERDAAGDE